MIQGTVTKNIYAVTSGNVGMALKKEIERRKADIYLISLIDKELGENIKEMLIGSRSSIIEVNLKEKYLSNVLLRRLVPQDSFDATYVEGTQYNAIIKKIIAINPDHIILPVGSGELFNSFYNYIRNNCLAIKLIGVAPKGSHALFYSEKPDENSLADKLSCKFMHPSARAKIEDALSNGHKIVEITNKDIMKAMKTAKVLRTEVEYSGSVSLAILPRIRNKKVVCILTGNGNAILNS